MSARNRRSPSYRRHKPSGQACVIIDGKHVYLGRFNSAESHEKYHRLVAEWLTAGHRPDSGDRPGDGSFPTARRNPKCSMAFGAASEDGAGGRAMAAFECFNAVSLVSIESPSRPRRTRRPASVTTYPSPLEIASLENNPDRRPLFPFAAGEVGELNGNALACDRLLAQCRNGAPCRRIVDIHVGICPRLQCVDQAVVFDEIHAAVTGALRLFRQRSSTADVHIRPSIFPAAPILLSLLLPSM